MNQGTYPPYTNINPNGNTSSPYLDPNYAENLFSLNRGKKVSIYFSYPDSVEWRDKVFTGNIVSSGKDYVVLKQNDNTYVLAWLVYINYAIFDDTASF